jgi:DNA-binding HxlR family transcriptional regulator
LLTINSPSATDLRDAEVFIRLLGVRWMLERLTHSGHRYQDLHETLDGISHKVLTETLRRSERERLIAPHLGPSRNETATLYELTDVGRSLELPLAALGESVEANWRSVEAARHR